MLDLDKPIIAVETHRRNLKRFDPKVNKYDLEGSDVRVICRDRVCPVGFTVVALMRNPKAMFGDEEFIVSVDPKTGQVSGNGFDDVYLINSDDYAPRI